MDVAVAVKEGVDRSQTSPVLVFDDETSEVIDLDLRGTVEDVRKYAAQWARPGTRANGAVVAPTGRPAPAASDSAVENETQPRGPGRPRLGVVAREVTLLPRHWEWLATQPGGASAALRRLVEQARRTHAGRDRIRRAQNAAYRFMSAMAGDEPGFEESARALFGGNHAVFAALTERWPADVRDHARKLARDAFGEEAGS